MSSHTQSEESIDHEQAFPFVIDSDTDRGQINFCKNLLINLFEPGISPCKTEFPDVRIRRQLIDHYIKDIAKITQQYGIYTIGIWTPENKKYVVQTDDLDLEISKVFTEYIKNIQYHNSQRANSIFTNENFAIICTNLNILETTETQSTSPIQTSRHTKVRNEIIAFSTFLYAIRESFSNNDVSQNSKQDLQKILAWFIIDHFGHNIDLIDEARKYFRPQSNTDDTVIHEQSDYVWDPDWSHPFFIHFPNAISSQAIDTISIHRDYINIIPFTVDATPLNYGAAQNWFSVLPIDIKSDWKRFTQEFSKMFDFERNKQHQRVLCNEIRRLAVQIETLVRKAYSLNTHDYMNTKLTEILMMTLTPQLRKIAIEKRASHPSSSREPDLDFRKLVDKLEQAEITIKLEETEKLK